MSRIGGLLRWTFGVIKEHVGWIVWAKWVVVAVNATEFEYLEGSISSENQNYREHTEGKAREYEEGLVAWPTQTIAEGHAAFSFGQPKTSEEHVRTANIFQPDSWTPTAKIYTHKKQQYCDTGFSSVKHKTRSSLNSVF
uniref:Uncharacterized protein n=1 Tax=Oncorhynchus kisutch TaxID=8019 RepID=A0A8C7KCS3_ONCKI